jgi:hypothetical protein
MLAFDRQRLRESRRAAGWQLCYKVWNFAPALQVVGVEQQQADGTWKLIQSCPTIEFQTGAARPRSNFIREHAAPVDWPDDRANPPRLRIALRGVGEVKVGDVALVGDDGRRRAVAVRGWKKLGRPAPRRGWPEVELHTNQAVLDLRWRAER